MGSELQKQRLLKKRLLKEAADSPPKTVLPPGDVPQLSHLVLYPDGGICNRLRAIASARRLCKLLKARCSVVWNWGNFNDYFVKPGDLEIKKPNCDQSEVQICHFPMNLNGNRTVDVSVKSVDLISGYVFWGSHEEEVKLGDIKQYLPLLAPRLLARVKTFSRNNFKNTVGFHMRRTDNTKCIENSPDDLFIQKGHQVVSGGGTIFLATDNIATEFKMKRIFGDSIVTYPRRQVLNERWPREFDPTAMEDDLMDLFLLVEAQYIIGSYWSSYSGLAILLNGSKQSIKLRIT